MPKVVAVLVLLLMTTVSPVFALTFTSLDPVLNIGPSAGTVTTSTLTIRELATIADLDVWVHITHTRDADLDVSLQSPSGLIVELFSDVGGDSNNFSNTTLDDDAALDITAGTGPFNDMFRPEGQLSAFNALDIQGTWTLRIVDDSNGDQGKLHGWSLVIGARQVPGPATLLLLGAGLLVFCAAPWRRPQQ